LTATTPSPSAPLLDWSKSTDTLAKLLYIHFQSMLEGGEPSLAAPSEALLVLGTGSGDEILWALVASAATSSLVGPASQRAAEVVLTNRPIGVVLETLPYTLPWGLVHSIVPRRLICSPENIAAALVLERALEILRRAPQSLQQGLHEIRMTLERVRRESWLSRVLGACTRPDRGDERMLAEQALERIRSGATPPYFRVLVPILESLARPETIGAMRAPQGLEGLSKLAELIALAGALDATNSVVTRHAYRRGVFQSESGSVIVCYQRGLTLGGEECLRPDIVVIDLGGSGPPRIIVIEVKSSTKGDESQVYSGLHQLLAYLYAINHGAKPDCTSHNIRLSDGVETFGVLAIYNPNDGAWRGRLSKCLNVISSMLGVSAISVWDVGPTIRNFLSTST